MLSVRLPALAAGTSRSSVVLSPIWPAPFPPQQYAAPAGVTAQVCTYPASRVAKVTPAGAPTGTGTGLSTVVLSPSWPDALAPQQYTTPFVARPQLWKKPVVRVVNVTPAGACTSTGLS